MKGRKQNSFSNSMATEKESEKLLKKAEQLRKLVNYSGLTYQPLHADFAFACKQWRLDKSSQFWSRTVIRCLCAAVEATLFSFRKMAEQMATLANVQFTADEIEILSERRIIEKNGIQTARPKYLPFSDAAKESFKLFAKAVGATISVNYDSGFADLCTTFEVRNRLMHPKKPFDVEVNLNDIQTAERGVHWFNKSFVGVIDQCQEHIGRNVAHQIEILIRKNSNRPE
jgi:hypothetical protein